MKKNGDLYFELFLKEPASYGEPCTSAFGVCSSHFTVRTEVDLPPKVKMLYPGKNKFATPRGKIPIKSETEDDFGIRSIKLRRKVNDGKFEEVPFTTDHNDKPYKSETIQSTYPLNMKSLDLENGDRVFYAIKAEDTGSRNDATTSKTYRFSIIPASQLEVKLQKLQQEIRDELEALRDDQKKLVDRVRYNLDQMKKEGKKQGMSEEMDTLLEQRRNKQRSLTQQMKRIGNELRTLHLDAKHNKLWDQKSRKRLRAIYGLAETVYQNEMPPASEQLAKALNAVDFEQRVSFVQQSHRRQKKTLRKLDVLLNQMGKWLEYADVIHEWKGILKDLKTLREDYLNQKSSEEDSN